MNLLNTKALRALIHSVHQEIAKHKWIESQKVGHDIGFQRALEDWFRFHFPQWVRYEKDRTVKEALHLQEQGLLRQ